MKLKRKFRRILELTAIAAGISLIATGANAATIVFGSVHAQGFGAYIESKNTLAEVRAAYQCAAGSQCVEMADCSGGGYATIAYKYVNSAPVIAGSCGFSSQAEADAAALQACGTGCNLGDQWLDSLPSAGTQCGTFSAPNSGCGGTQVVTLGDNDCLFSWAESRLPQYFSPAGQQNQNYQSFIYRYYPSTGNYLGFGSGEIYVMGSSFGGAPLSAGPMSAYLSQARASSCR